MAQFNAQNIINRLKNMSGDDKKKNANSDTVIKSEINNVMEDTKISLYRQSREKAAKYVLWQGLLNQYGLFGTQKNSKRTFGKNKDIYYDEVYMHGDLISIDFGTSNFDKEFSFTHTAIVLKSYTDYIVVIPTTSCKEGRLENRPADEQADTMKITSNDFKEIESDSYIMLYQTRSVSKNRIQKVIGTIKDTELMKKIDYKISEIFAPATYYDVNALRKELGSMKEQNIKIHEELNIIEHHIENVKNILTQEK